MNKLLIKFGRDVAGGLICPEFKAGDGGTIEGYGSIFGNIDSGYDIVERGAFADSLGSGKKIKMLWQHDALQPIGVWDEVVEDDKGLRVKGSLIMDVAAGKEAAALVKAGAIDGLSIGYNKVKARRETVDGKEVRIIEKVNLWEVSLVTFPMNIEATIDAVKAAEMSIREFGRDLVRDSKMTRQVVDALMRDGWKGVQALSDSGDDDDLSDLACAILAQSKQKQQILRG